MEIPEPIQQEVEKKGGIEGMLKLLPNEEEIEKEGTVHYALSDPLRLKILNLLILQPLCVCLIKEAVKISDSKLSYHLSILRKNDLIEGKREGNWIIYHATRMGKQMQIE